MTEPDYDDPDSFGGAEDDSDEGELLYLPGAFPCTDTGNAERFAATFANDAHFLEGRNKWLFWDTTHWALDEGSVIGRKVKATVRGIKREAEAIKDMDRRKGINEWAQKSEAAGKRQALEQLARSEPGMAVSVDQLDQDLWALNCENGTLDLRTGKLRPHMREDLITKCTGVNYIKGATSELWDKVLRNLHRGDTELSDYLQRIAGYALTGLSTEKLFFFLSGPPDGGKSSYMAALLSCLGSYARTTPSETWLERTTVGGNRDDLVSLQGMRLVVSSEIQQNARWDTAIIKQITGGDRISASAKYESQIEFSPQCTILLAANHPPKANDDDEGFWRRMQRIPIDTPLDPGEQIKGIGETLRLPEHAEAILAWAVEGCRMWRELGGIGTARAVEESTAAYRAENDWIGGFLELYELDAQDSVISAPNFRSQYEDYCKQEGQRPEATKTLAKRIEKRCPGVRYKMVRGSRMWCGLQRRGDPGPAQQSLGMPPEERFE